MSDSAPFEPVTNLHRAPVGGGDAAPRSATWRVLTLHMRAAGGTHEVCGDPDTGKVMVRPLRAVGRLEGTAYLDGESEPLLILQPAHGPESRCCG